MAETPSPRGRAADALIERSKSLSEIGRWKDAELQARRAVEADPGYVRARLCLAHILTTQGRGNEGADLATGVLAQEPSSEWAHRILANWHGSQGRHGEAVARAEQAVRLSSGDRLALLCLSHMKRNAGDLLGSRIAAERLVSDFPDWPEGFVQLAATRRSPEEAAQAYREALRLDPHCDAALTGLAGLSGALAQYREAVSLAWEALRADLTDKARQRRFARSAWTYLTLSRIVAPLRGTHRALAEPFGEACARAFRATGRHFAARLAFAFRFELWALAVWLALVAGMLGAAQLPGDLSGILTPLLGIPVFLGLIVPVFMVLGFIGAARRLLDLRILQWAGRGTAHARLARAAVSGAAVLGIAITLLLLWPAWAGIWVWLLLAGVLLTVQDFRRWRDQWLDRRRTTPGSRRQLAALVRERAQRSLTGARLALVLALALLAEIALRGIGQPISPSEPPATAVAALGALLCGVIDLGARRRAAGLEPGPRADAWRALGWSLMVLAWLGATVTATVAIGGRLLENRPIEALFPILILPLVLAGGWSLLRASRALLGVAASEIVHGVRGLWHRWQGRSSRARSAAAPGPAQAAPVSGPSQKRR